MASDTDRTEPQPSLTLGKVVLCYICCVVLVIPIRLLISHRVISPVEVTACAVVAVSGATITWLVYHSASRRRDGLAVGIPLLMQPGSADANWLVLVVVTVVVFLPAAYMFGAWLRTNPPPPAA